MSYIRSNSVQTGNNQFTEYGRSSRRSRRSSGVNTCGDAVCVTLIGFVLIIGSIIVQFVTEQNYIAKLHDINAIQRTVIDMNQYNLFKTIQPSDPVYIADTFHLSSNSQPPIDSDTGVTHNAFVIHKDIEMYQWIEKKSKRKEHSNDGQSSRTVTTYDYVKQWTSTYHTNARFRHPEGHYNPQNNEFMASQNKKKYFWSTKMMLGEYYISHQIRSMLTDKTAPDWQDITRNVYKQYYASRSQWDMKYGFIYWTYGEVDPYGEPNVGDVRMKWTALDLDGSSGAFLGSLAHSNQLRRYVSDNSNEYVYLKVGRRDSIADIIASFHSDNAGKLYLFRGLTLVCMCIGFICTSSLVNYILSYIPFFGGIIGCALNLVVCAVAVVFWLVFFAIAYLSARKEVAIGLIVAILLGLVLLQQRAAAGAKETGEDDRKSD
eukprot:265313_1